MGDSNVVYLALTEHLLISNYPIKGFCCQLIEPDDTIINFIGNISKTAYGVDENFLEFQFSKLNISPDGHIAFMYGTSDISGGHLLRNNNHIHVLDKYMNTCIQFAKTKNMTPIFVGPTFSTGNDFCFDLWRNNMKQKSIENKVAYIDPHECIDELDNFSWDEFGHLGKKASANVFDSIKGVCN
jgi:hypothetical protein